MQKRKITLITSDRKGLLIRPIRMARALVRSGYEVKILAWDRDGNREKVEYIEGSEVRNFRFKTPSFKGLVLFPWYLIWWIYVAFVLLRDDADTYHSQDLYNFIPVIPIKIVRRKRAVYDLVDFVADSFSCPEFIRRILARLENFCLRFADGVIVVNIKKQQINLSNVRRLAVVTNCPIDLIDKFRTTMKQGEFLIYYGGWISETRGLKQVCKAIRNVDGVKLVVAGFGPDERELRRIFDAQENVEFKGLLSDTESLEWTSRADLVFAFYDPRIRINRLASPAKLFDAMMCGKPVLANSEALLVADIINREKCGLLVPYDDIGKIRSSIKKLKEDTHLRTEMGQNARKAFEREYNWAEMETRLLTLYNEVFCNKGINSPLARFEGTRIIL